MTVINLQSRPEPFGACYECRAGFHARCIGVPCQCDCPELSVQEAFERLMQLRDSEVGAAAGHGGCAAINATDRHVHQNVDVELMAAVAAHHALNVMSIDVLIEEIRRLHRLINSPEIQDFTKAVVLEAAHQRERWPDGHDANKSHEDWFWLIGYLAGKALGPDQPTEKRLHRIITIAAAAANWHAQTNQRTEGRA